ncbi:MAG: bioB 4 [Sporomusa sp.]|jgi:uncharacterized radical SAM superfamily protein|nr:bioB 4 [Sporomusa sp.]
MTKIAFYAPGSRHYDNGLFENNAHSFVNISITGTQCQCNCEHCQGQLLNTMVSATKPELLVSLATDLCSRGCRGVLVSGGACSDGSVPLMPFISALKEMAAMGLSVVVHPGLLTAETAELLAQANITRVALDLIGDSDTIRDVYHLQRTPKDYHNSLQVARRAGLKVSPHIVLGLHFGQIRGEYHALNMVAAEGATSLVLVILNPLRNTRMSEVIPPPPEEIAEIFTTARRLLPTTPITLGCARPPGNYSRTIERLAVEAGLNAIAYPARETVDYVQSLGYDITYLETCCGIASN